MSIKFTFPTKAFTQGVTAGICVLLANKDAAPSPFAPSRHPLQNSPAGAAKKGKAKLRKREKRKNSDYTQENNAANEGNSSILQKLY